MHITLIGYGKMGRAVEKLAPKRGHDIVHVVSRTNPATQEGFSGDWLGETDVVIDFSIPSAAALNIRCCIAAGLPIVQGTTGWLDQMDDVRRFVNQHQGTCIYASNFSVGVQVLFRVARYTGGLMAELDDYSPFISETHHSGKLDAPSGTAQTIRDVLGDHYEHAIPVSSLRAGHFPGRHDVGFDSDIDTLVLSHTARNRLGFANGALLAAEKTTTVRGFVDFSDVLFPES